MEWVWYSLDGAFLDERYVNKTQNCLQLNYPCSNSSSCYPYNVTLIPGVYLLQLHGAAGGDGSGGLGGKGGYSTGSIVVTSQTTFYVFVGGKGASNTGSSGTIVDGGFNGGGTGKVGVLELRTGGGGGATDIRNGTKQLIDRIIVAGGGGGGSGHNTGTSSEYGGDGGGEEGESGGLGPYQYPGSGGTQSSSGTNPRCSTCNGISNVGGPGYSGGSTGGGGGGGYYGGAGGLYTGGGGGSGYIGGITSEAYERLTSNSTNHNDGHVIIHRMNTPENCKAQVSCQRKYPFGFNFSYIIIIALTK